eukprot:9285933-Karenia_brevis.AAC.1
MLDIQAGNEFAWMRVLDCVRIRIRAAEFFVTRALPHTTSGSPDVFSSRNGLVKIPPKDARKAFRQFREFELALHND